METMSEQEVKEIEDRCDCGGEIDRLINIDRGIWRGRCFQCGKPYNVIEWLGVTNEDRTVGTQTGRKEY